MHYNPLALRGPASAVLPTIHRRPEMGPPIAAKDARSFNGIAYSILPSSARFHLGPRCDHFLHVFSTYPFLNWS